MLKMFMKKNNKKGFTLVELMVVVAIIGILVVIAVPIYNAAQDNARLNACRANLRTINGAISMYYAESSGYPADVAALVPNYLQAEPTCPDGGTYSIDATHHTAQCTVTGHTLP